MEKTTNQNKYIDKLSEMTLEEKARLVNGATFFGMAAIKRLGIPRLQLLDGGTGMNFEQLFGDFYSQMEVETNSTGGMVGSTVLTNVIDNYYQPEKLNDEEMKVYHEIKEKLDGITRGEYAPGCFPPGILLGATFNPEAVHAVGEALGAEGLLFGIDILLGTPNVNIHRDPLNGRLFEGYSEDPCLVSVLAPELVKGVQKFGIAADVKHFAANNQETNRVGINETISERALKEIYLPGFKACVQDGQAKTVMSAYNRINGTPCTENYWLLTEELRDNWGFDGMVVSDWGAVYHSVEAVEAGNDVAMPGPIDGTPLVEAVREGRLKEEVLDLAVERVLRLIDDLAKLPIKEDDVVSIGEEQLTVKAGAEGYFDKEKLYEATKKVAYDAAIEGTVLLKNENQTLPFNKEDVIGVAILGSAAEQLLECGTGSAGITTNRTSSLEEGLVAEFGTKKVFLPNEGGYQWLSDVYSEKVMNVCVQDKTVECNGDVTDTVGTGAVCETKQDCNIQDLSHIIVVVKVSGMEGNDRKDLNLDLQDDMLLLQLKELKKQHAFKLTVVLNVCGPVDTTTYEEFTDAIMVCFLPGMEGGHALADLMLGKKSPSGKLPITFPRRYEDTPTFLNFPGDGCEVNYGEGIYVGYRYYDKKKIAPAYAFGYGLSYTTFEISDLKIDATSGVLVSEMTEGQFETLDKNNKTSEMQLPDVDAVTFHDAIRVSVTVKNTGNMAGAEVIQLYISDTDSTLPKPVKELKAFRKVYLNVGENKEVAFTLTKEQFASYDMDYHAWIAEEGFYEIIIATSSAERDIKQSQNVYLINKTPYSYGVNSTIKVLYEEPQLKESLRALWSAKQWDWQIVESNYQYTPNRKLVEVLPEQCNEDDELLNMFVESVVKVVKL